MRFHCLVLNELQVPIESDTGVGRPIAEHQMGHVEIAVAHVPRCCPAVCGGEGARVARKMFLAPPPDSAGPANSMSGADARASTVRKPLVLLTTATMKQKDWCMINRPAMQPRVPRLDNLTSPQTPVLRCGPRAPCGRRSTGRFVPAGICRALLFAGSFPRGRIGEITIWIFGQAGDRRATATAATKTLRLPFPVGGSGEFKTPNRGAMQSNGRRT